MRGGQSVYGRSKSDRKDTVNPNAMYFGECNPGRYEDTTASVWAIYKINFSGEITWAEGNDTPNKSWTLRATYNFK